MVADIEELEEMDESELHASRLNAKEVLTQMEGDHYIFPVVGRVRRNAKEFFTPKMVKTSSSLSQVEQLNCLEEIMESENQP